MITKVLLKTKISTIVDEKHDAAISQRFVKNKNIYYCRYMDSLALAQVLLKTKISTIVDTVRSPKILQFC